MNFKDRWVEDDDGKRFVFTVEMQRRLQDAGLPIEPESLSELSEAAPARPARQERPARTERAEKPAESSRSESSAFEEPATIQIDPESGKYLGRLKWYNSQRGYGFIARGGGEDIFFHKSDSLIDPETLAEGQWVLYDVEESEKGLEANEIEPFGEDASG